MKHPLDFIPSANRKPVFFAFLAGTLIVAAIMQGVGAPLKTSAAPMGIVSYELAGTPEGAASILSSWDGRVREYAAFGLGLDYLFMPTYALALALGVLLALGRHTGRLASLGNWVGWGSLAAALFDATENLALWRVLLGEALSAWPQVAAICATIKFALILIGLGYAVLGGLLPKSR